MNNEPWIDIRLSAEEMNFLWDAISEENKAGNISNRKSDIIEDKRNWFFEGTLKPLTERLFYDDWKNYRKYYIVKEEPPPKFEMDRFWVNYQYQHEFNPLHDHSGLYSFVIFMKIPTHWKEQHEKNFDQFRGRVASDFMFVWSSSGKKKGRSDRIVSAPFALSPEDEGRMLFFPATLHHLVYPFYGTEESRVTISGNILLNDPKKLEKQTQQEMSKEKMLKILENSVKVTKEELETMKKAREKKK